MRRILIVLLLMTSTAVGCGADAAHEKFEAAQLEERQNNLVHAKELYHEILTKYPKSEYAPKAEERIRALERGK